MLPLSRSLQNSFGHLAKESTSRRNQLTPEFSALIDGSDSLRTRRFPAVALLPGVPMGPSRSASSYGEAVATVKSEGVTAERVCRGIRVAMHPLRQQPQA